MKKGHQHLSNFDAISIKLASPEVIRDWSYGEVLKPETINYRTQRSEKYGLFDEKIFGPEKDYECFCGKYKGIRYKGIVCDRCSVEITRSIVRRERMGHIELASPVAHVWFLRSVPSRIALFLGLSASDVEKVVYFAGYIITKVIPGERERILKDIETEYQTKFKSEKTEAGKKKLKTMRQNVEKELEQIQEGKVLDESTYHKFSVKYGTLFEAGIGAEAIYNILKNINLEKYVVELHKTRETASSLEKIKLDKRIALVQSMIRSEVRPEWMFLTVIPVMPPALRPMVALEGGRHATSDVNDLYRRVINRNNRLKKLMDISAPEVILRNEKRILQEAVDALIDNSIRHGNTTFSMNQAQRRPLKSLADYLKGKQGYFRGNLLGKRVDYSGRSVIVIGPTLKLDECGLPKRMALELFRPFIIAKLLEREIAFNVPGARRLIEDGVPEVWATLEEVIEGKYVMLNRAPTLHRLGIQAFRPILIEGDAIQIHPMVCSAFNADFDGDQMAVHVPLSDEAQLEAREIMSANKGILKPGDAAPTVTPSQDIVLGCYWMTKIIEGKKGEGKYFQSPNAAITAYDMGIVDLRAKIKVLPTNTERYRGFDEGLFETSVGRLLFNGILPTDYPFLNVEMTKKELKTLVNNLIETYGLERIPTVLDKVKTFGFQYATQSGITWGMDDVKIPEGRDGILQRAHAERKVLESQFEEGLLSADERRRLSIEMWHKTKSEIEKLMPSTLDPNSSLYDIVTSGSRSSMGQVTQMAGMKGLIQNAQGDTLESAVTFSMKDGLPPLLYFVNTNGARKGLADTALQTARAGYLTRRLFDAAQDVIISEKDCGTKAGTQLDRRSASGIEIDFTRSLFGRVLAEDVVNEKGKTLFKRNELIMQKAARAIDESGVDSVKVRSPMTCTAPWGICAQCYGADTTTHELVDLGEAVGTIAAQAIGEPGTQLTMNTKHAGSASVGGDVVQGLPRVEEVFERRSPKAVAAIAKQDGLVSAIRSEGRDRVIVVSTEGSKKKPAEYQAPYPRTILIKEGDTVKKGDFLTDGSADITEVFKYAGKEKAQEYIIQETNKIYELQGVSITRKHIEILVRQMFARIKIKDSGETTLNVGDIVEQWYFNEINNKAKEEGKELAMGEQTLVGIKESALTRKSFLSSASFENTTRILINSAIRGATDFLRGPKENIIIGRLIPAGTGFAGSKKHKMIEELQEKYRREEMELEAASNEEAQARREN